MPGVQSLKFQQYYANPRNQFWKIIESLLDAKLADNYANKIKILSDHKIALWDVIHSCQRKGSLDSNLRNWKVNSFKDFLNKYPAIKAIFCNGQTAFGLFQQYHGDVVLPIFVLPSTSPAYTISFDQKLVQWEQILNFLK